METREILGYGSKSTALFLREACRGTVQMVNSAGVYLTLGDRLFLLCDSRWGIVPNGILLPDYSKIPGLLTPGAPVRGEKGCPFGAAGGFSCRKMLTFQQESDRILL